MANTNFTPGTPIVSSWLNDVNTLVYTAPTSTGASLIGWIQSGIGTIYRTIQDKLRETVSVKDFGAVGDGVTNDTAAFAAAAARIQLLGGGKIVIPAGTYIVGQQTFAGAFGKGYAYQAAKILKIENCTKPVVIQCEGCVIRMAPGLKFGSFNPTTGAVFNPTLPFNNTDYAAGLGRVFEFNNNSGGVSITGRFEIDGNNTKAILGGNYGDTGIQLDGVGIFAYGNGSLTIENGYLHHACSDNMQLGWTGAFAGMPKKPVTMSGMMLDYGGRQALSWVGGVGLTAINCKFTNTGKAINEGSGVALASSPGAGVDIEAENSVCRDGLFVNCEFANNSGQCMIADSGDSADVTFMDCRFYGVTQYAIWPRKPRFKFVRCLIAGGAVNAYNSPTEHDRTSFEDCLFSADMSWNGLPAKYSNTLADFFTSQNPRFVRTHFVTNQTTVRLPLTSGATYSDCDFLQNGSVDTALVRGEFRGKNIFTIPTGNNDFTGSTSIGDLTLNGLPVLTVLTTSPAYNSVRGQGNNGSVQQVNQIRWGYTPPADGVHGDIFINLLGSASGRAFWFCTVTSPTAAVWKLAAPIDA